MMRNRDTASNPYRVPKQTTARWIKVSIVGLFLSNVALIGAVVFIVFSMEQCTKVCRDREPTELANAEKQTISTEQMSRDDGENQLEEQQKSIFLVTSRVNQIEHTITTIKRSVTNLDQCCSKGMPDVMSRSTVPPSPPTFNTLVPDLRSLPGQVVKNGERISNLEDKVDRHIESSRQLCKNDHYRYGMHCYYVGEARLAEKSATQFCANDFDVRGTLAVVKDKFTHDFITSKLSNRAHSYWIGIKRQRQEPNAWASRSLQPLSEERDSGMAPLPLSGASGNVPFKYLDGTKVENNLWEMWGADATPGNDSHRRDCVALSYDRSKVEWYWQDHDCGSRLGYVCQYYILSIEQ